MATERNGRLYSVGLNVNRINIDWVLPFFDVSTGLWRPFIGGKLRWRLDSGTLRGPTAGGHRGDSGGPLAAIGSEPRQARKGATVVTDSGAGVWLLGSPPYSSLGGRIG